MLELCHPPNRSAEQRTAALIRANEIRSARCVAKQELASGELPATALFTLPLPTEWETWHVADAMRALRGVGPVKVRKILRGLNVSPSRTLAGLSARQRGELLLIAAADDHRRAKRRAA